MDTENTFNLDERLQIAQDEKSQQQRVLELWKQADDARHFGDLTGARDYLGQALQIDSRNTELQNAYSDLLRELKRHQQQLRLDELLQSAREENERQRYTEAISHLREAAEIDPVHPEVQSLLISRRPDRRRNSDRRGWIPPTQTSRIRSTRKDSDSAEDHATRLLETLPADGLPHQLTSEVEDKKRRVDIEQEVTALVSNLGLVANANDGADPTKLLKIPQQPHDQAQGESDLTLQFSEALLKAQLGEAPSVRLITELRAEQDKPVANAKEEIQAAINVAVTACDEAMAARNFDHCLHLLDDLEKQYPGNSLVAAARMTCESKRGQKAKQLLQEAIQMAQQQLAKNSAKRAEETLREVEGALPYVSSGRP